MPWHQTFQTISFLKLAVAVGYLGDVIDENCFHNCVGESEKALLVPVRTKGMTVNHENWIEQHSKQDSYLIQLSEAFETVHCNETWINF